VKVFYITNALTHYYNLVLSKLNSEDDIELVCVAPKGNNSYLVGEGVNLTTEGINFKVIYLAEKRRFFLYSTLKGLSQAIASEKPDVVIVLNSNLTSFLFDISLRRVIKSLNIKLILSDHPFRLLSYQNAIKEITSTYKEFKSLPQMVNKLINVFKIDKLWRKIQLEIKKKSFSLPDAHVHYIEASGLLGSYGVPREKIFITRNSPDTDKLFKIKEKIENLPCILSTNPYRLVHVGRLVPWKRVDMLIRAFSTVKKQFPESELLIIGVGPEENRLKQITNKLKLGDSVVFFGGVYEQKLLGQYLMASTLYVLAGMGGISINDAMCFGLPILCSVCDGTEKFLVREGENGRYFKEGDMEDLSKKIIWFFDNLKLMSKMGSRSENIIRHEVNIHTVIQGYKDAFCYVTS
jgi:glycosyltransferase involved in cell wall biosynthesis